MTMVFKFIPGTAKLAPSIRAFSSKKDANAIGNSGATFSSADELKNLMVASSHELVVVHNRLSPDKPVTKFQDRETAARRVFALVESMKPEASLSAPNGNGDSMDKTVSNKAAADADKTKAANAAKEAKAKLAQEKKDKAAAAKADKAKLAKDKKDAAAKKKAEGGGKAGRASSLAGKILKGVPGEGGKLENGRRPGSHGFRSLQLVIEGGKTGIRFEDYITKGGRNKDAKWDIEHGAIVAEDAKK